MLHPMAVDIQFTYPQEVIGVTSVQAVQGSNPLQLEIIGDDFSSVESVEINSIPVDGFVVYSKTRLVAVSPAPIQDAGQVVSVTVTSSKLVLTEQSFFRFKFGKVPGKVRGILKLCQLFVKILFTTPGSDIFSPKVGGAGLKNLGRSINSSEIESVIADFIISVQSTTRQIIALQSKTPSLPVDERLMNAKVLGSSFSPQETALKITVELTSQSGQTSFVNMVV